MNTIRQSFAPTTRRFVTPTGTGHPMQYGDRIFVRLTQGHRVLLEITLTQVNDFTELIGELRHHTRSMRGLCSMYVRNVSRGWSMERPLMLYSSAGLGLNLSAPVNTPVQIPPRTSSRMLKPWETH